MRQLNDFEERGVQTDRNTNYFRKNEFLKCQQALPPLADLHDRLQLSMKRIPKIPIGFRHKSHTSLSKIIRNSTEFAMKKKEEDNVFINPKLSNLAHKYKHNIKECLKNQKPDAKRPSSRNRLSMPEIHNIGKQQK